MRVYSANIKWAAFNLQLYADYGQNPLSIPYYFDVSPCRNNHNFYLGTTATDIYLSLSSSGGTVHTYNMYPTYHNLFHNSQLNACPILRYEIKDGNGNAFSHSSITFVNPNSPTTTKMTVKNDTPYTIFVRIYSFVLFKQAYAQFQIRVCGQETVSVVDPTYKFFIYGIETGSSLSTSQRYGQLSQSSFQPYFTIGNEQSCSFDKFEILSSINPDVSWPTSNNKISIGGSLGSYIIYMDKTQAMNGQTFYIRARTRGLIYARQQVKVTVCPKSGGYSYTKPAPYSPTTLDTTSGGTYTLATNSLFQQVAYYARGSSAYARFDAWSISDVYLGCGKFKEYGISASYPSSSYVRYPPSGYSISSNCRYNLNNCRFVEMTSTSSIRMRYFTLYMYPDYGQNPISIPYVVDVTPCSSHAYINVYSSPPTLTLDKSPLSSNFVEQNVYPTYSNYFSQSYTSYCPILRYDLLNTQGNSFSDSRVSILNGNSKTGAKLRISNVETYVLTLRIRAFTMNLNNYVTLTVRICGTETVTLTSTARRFYIYGQETGDTRYMSDSTRYKTISQSTVATYFQLNPTWDACVIDHFELLQSVSPDVPWPDSSVLLTGSFGNHQLKMDKTVPTNTKSFFLRARTRGYRSAEQQFDVVICPRTGGNTITPPPQHSPTTIDATSG